MIWTVRAFYESLSSCYTFTMGGQERIVSYLPLSHATAQLADINMTMYTASTVYFAQPDALKGSLVKTLGEARPTVFPGVPRLVLSLCILLDFYARINKNLSIILDLCRVWEKFHEQMLAAAAEITGVKRILGKWAKDVAFQANTDILNK